MEKYIGCSGYYYDHWKGLFYPETLPKREWLKFYAEHFGTVEINNTFYRMPDEKTIKHWHSITPESFMFAVKGFRYFTHLKKLVIDEELIDNLAQFQHNISFLKDKLGPILWQLPGSFTVNLKKLDKFCAVLSNDFMHTFEFRHSSWFTKEVFDVLTKHSAALCIVSSPGNLPDHVIATSEIAYIRFHGQGSWYRDNYSNEDLQQWKQKLEVLPVKKLYAYFNNDIGGYAVHNGMYMARLFGITIKQAS